MNVEYTRELSEDRVFCGDTVDLHIRITNRKLIPLAWLEVEDSLADRLRISERDILPSGTPGVAVLRMTTAMRWYERVTWNLTVECPARGYFAIGPVDLRSADAFGFFQQRERYPKVDHVTVYPAIADLDSIIVPARHLFGDQRIVRPIITDPMRTIGVRDYRPEGLLSTHSLEGNGQNTESSDQSVRTDDIDSVRDLPQPRHLRALLGRPRFRPRRRGDHHRGDDGVPRCRWPTTWWACTRNGVVGGSDQGLRIRPSRDESQLEQILTGLAKLSPIASLDYAAIVRAETARFPIGSTVVLVTAIMTDRMRGALDGLLRANHRVVIVTVGDIDVPSHPRIEIYSIDEEALNKYIPRHHHYAVSMSNMPVPPLEMAVE